MSDEAPKNGHGTSPVIRVVVEMTTDGRVACQGNADAGTCINVLSQGIVAMARHGWKEENKSLVQPVSGAMPPLRRIP